MNRDSAINIALFSATVGFFAGIYLGDGVLILLSLCVGMLSLALTLNYEMRDQQRTGHYPKGWEHWGAG